MLTLHNKYTRSINADRTEGPRQILNTAYAIVRPLTRGGYYGLKTRFYT